MKTIRVGAFRVWLTAALGLALLGCGSGDISGEANKTGGVDRTGGPGASLVLPGLGFVATSFGFY